MTGLSYNRSGENGIIRRYYSFQKKSSDFKRVKCIRLHLIHKLYYGYIKLGLLEGHINKTWSNWLCIR